ncbi:hypothetical protein D3C76_890470 [compost metagenome]
MLDCQVQLLAALCRVPPEQLQYGLLTLDRCGAGGNFDLLPFHPDDHLLDDLDQFIAPACVAEGGCGQPLGQGKFQPMRLSSARAPQQRDSTALRVQSERLQVMHHVGMRAAFHGGDEQLVIRVLEAAGIGVAVDMVLLPTTGQQRMQRHPRQGRRAFQLRVPLDVLDAFDRAVQLLQPAQHPVQRRVVVVAAIHLLHNALALLALECAQQVVLQRELDRERFGAARPQLHLHLATGLDLRVDILGAEELGFAAADAHQQELALLALPLQVQRFAILRDDA